MASNRAGDYQPAEHHPAFEEYCETIFELREDSVGVIQARIADRMGISRPAVSEMIRRMEHEGLIAVLKGSVSLTADGLALAERVVRRHRLAERLLTDVLGLSWSLAHSEAGKWEHVISEPVERALMKLLGDPTTCPHGNPIPGSGYAAPNSVTLSQIPVGNSFTVTRIPEELEFEPGMLDFLEDNLLRPGFVGIVTAAGPSITVEIDGRTVDIDPFASDRILVAAS